MPCTLKINNPCNTSCKDSKTRFPDCKSNINSSMAQWIRAPSFNGKVADSGETIIAEKSIASIIVGVFLISFYIGYLKNSTNCLDFATIIVSHQK